MSTRRKFLTSAAAAMTAAHLVPFVGKAATVEQYHPGPKATILQMGIAGYTFLNFSIEQSISIMQRVGINALSIKDFHLPLDSSASKIQEVKDQFRSAGINIYAAGVIYMKLKEDVDRAFEYAQRLGVDLIVASPNYEMLPQIELKVKSSNVKMAIHNHGPEDKSYPGAKDIFEKVHSMDPRIGICLDIGHSSRAGEDPVKAITSYAARIFDLHIKDLNGISPNAQSIELGRGVLDIPALINALKKINYQGKCSIEFEKDMKDPLPGIAESVGFLRGVLQSLKG